MTNDLRSGKVKSCGCIRKETARLRGKETATHGMTGSRIWNIWQGMKQRCVRNKNYKHVSVCSDWESFSNFYDWAITNGYEDGLTLDRIDPLGNYEPSNCRWATWKVQENNRRNNRKIEYKGKVYTLAQLSELLNVGVETLRNRIESGWPEEDLTMTPNLNNKNLRRGQHVKQNYDLRKINERSRA